MRRPPWAVPSPHRALQSRDVHARCAAGEALEYRVHTGDDHLSFVQPGSRFSHDPVAWTLSRFAGVRVAVGRLTTAV